MNIVEIENDDGIKFGVRPDSMDYYVVKEQKQYLKKIHLTNDDIWLDAGAHIGTFTLSICRKVKGVFAYEPNHENFDILSYNMFLNSVHNVSLNRYAIIGNKDAQREFFINRKKNTGGHSFFIKKGREKVICDCRNINTIFYKHKINKIKMDIEGAEYEVLQAITPKNYEKLQEIILEFHFNILKDHPEHKKYEEIILLLYKHFQIVDFNPNINKHWHTLIHAYKQGL